MHQHADNVRNRNRELKAEFDALGLSLEDVFQPIPDDLGRENGILGELLKWVRAYRACPHRRELERKGLHFPPVEPDFDPDTDWLRFERWVNHEPVSWHFTTNHGSVADPAGLTDAQVETELTRIASLLSRRGVAIGIREDVPPTLVLRYLRDYLAETRFDIAAPGSTWHVDGCSGYCPECFQRPWCDTGRSSCWPEDEDAGRMVVPESAAPFASNCPTLCQLRDADAGGW